MDFSYTYLFWAFLLGIISAASLPLGSWVGLITQPKRTVIGFLAAFGAGALFAALAVELVAPTLNAITSAGDLDGQARSAAIASFGSLVVGMFVGCISFVVLDQLVNAHGGFLRKSATTMAWFTQKKKTTANWCFTRSFIHNNASICS